MSGRPRHPLSALTQTVAEHRRRLLDDYQPSDLHQWRVHIRRIRSLMKYVPACQDRALRSAWRELFVVSNPARDWDVFMAAIPTLLPPPSAVALGEALEPTVQRHRERVLAMLASRRWHGHLDEWRAFLASLGQGRLALPPTVLPEVQSQADRARERAFQDNDQAAWHRLRIATKNLRYVTDAMTAAGSLPQLAELIEACKAVQDELGDWHDCMVQLELIDAPLTRQALAHLSNHQELRDALAAALRHRRNALLERARASLVAFPDRPGGEPQPRLPESAR